MKNTTPMTEMDAYKQQQKEKQQQLMGEQFQVVVKFPSQPHNLRLTYSNKKSNKVVAIEEITPLEEVISTSTFKGKSCSGFCSSDIKALKPELAIKATQWLTTNPDLWIDEYFKNN